MIFGFLALLVTAVVTSAAAAIATAIAFAIAHPFITAAIIAATAYLRAQAKKGAKAIDPGSYRRSEPTSQTAARWIYGRARVGGVPCFVAEKKSGRFNELYMVYLLSEGEIEGIERIYINGREMPIQDDAHLQDVIHPVVNTFTLPGFFGGQWTITIDESWPGFRSMVDFVARERARNEDERTGQDWIDRHGLYVRSTIEFHLHRGGDASAMNTFLRAANVGWSSEHKLQGVSAVGVRVRDVKGRDYWTSIPKIEFVVRGIKIQEPDGTEAVWTENAASIRRHWLINVRGLDAAKIDLPTYYAARATCAVERMVPEVAIGDDDDDTKTIHASDVLTATFGDDEATWPSVSVRQRSLDLWNWRHAGAANREINYSINGVIEADLDDREVEDRMDFAMAGHCVEWNGKVRFYPGRETPADLTLGETDIVAASPPSWQIEPRLEEKVSSLVAVVPQSAQHDWLEFSMPKIAVAGEEDVAPVDLGALPLVAYPKTASRLMKMHLARANGGRTGTLTAMRGANWENFGIYPSRRISVDLPTEGLDHTATPNRFFVLSAEFDFAGTVSLEVQQEGDGTYEQVADIPLTFEEAGGYLGNVSLRLEAPADVRMRYRRLADEPGGTYSVSVYFMVAADDPDGDDIDLRYLQARVRNSATITEVAGPWNLSPIGHGLLFFGVSSLFGGWDYQVRWVYPYGTTEWAAQQTLAWAASPPQIPTGYSA